MLRMRLKMAANTMKEDRCFGDHNALTVDVAQQTRETISVQEQPTSVASKQTGVSGNMIDGDDVQDFENVGKTTNHFCICC